MYSVRKFRHIIITPSAHPASTHVHLVFSWTLVRLLYSLLVVIDQAKGSLVTLGRLLYSLLVFIDQAKGSLVTLGRLLYSLLIWMVATVATLNRLSIDSQELIDLKDMAKTITTMVRFTSGTTQGAPSESIPSCE